MGGAGPGGGGGGGGAGGAGAQGKAAAGKGKDAAAVEKKKEDSGKGAAGKGKGGGGAPAPKGKAKATPTKPVITPKKKMQGLWWGDPPLIMGTAKLPQGTIFDQIPSYAERIPEGPFCDKFGSDKPQPGGAAGAKAKAFRLPAVKAGQPKKQEEIRVIQIITDQSEMIEKTTALHGAPDPNECVSALMELDDTLTVDTIDALMTHACPDEVQFESLRQLRERYPTVPMAAPERFMWVFGQVPMCKQRLEVWHFTRTAQEAAGMHSTRIKEFETICDSIMASPAVRNFFGLVLAMGNYMNGGTPRGRYDGFYVEKTFEAMSNCKDKNNDTLAKFIIGHFAESEPDEFESLIEDLQPTLLNLSRRIKQKEGADIINKNPKVNIEDYDSIVNGMKAHAGQMKGFLKQILGELNDDSDAFKLRMPGLFGDAEKSVNGLVELRDNTKAKYAQLLKYLAMDSTLPADKFCVMFDNFFVPESRLLGDSQLKSKFILPVFCSDKPCTGQNLRVLWGFQDFKEEAKGPRHAAAGGAKKKRKSTKKGVGTESHEQQRRDSGHGSEKKTRERKARGGNRKDR